MNEAAKIVILRAQQLLLERDWCQKTAARNRIGLPTEPRKSSAVALDIVGALQLAAVQLYPAWVIPYDAAYNELDRITRARFSHNLIQFNDELAETKEDVLRLFEGAVKQ